MCLWEQFEKTHGLVSTYIVYIYRKYNLYIENDAMSKLGNLNCSKSLGTGKYPKYQCFLPTPVSNVIPATVILVEALHSPHITRTLLEGQAWLGWLISVMDI